MSELWSRLVLMIKDSTSHWSDLALSAVDQEVYLPARHQHPLVFKRILGDHWECDSCRELIFDKERYRCDTCKEGFHKECVELPQEINYPLHARHPLALSFFKDIDLPGCDLCEEGCFDRRAYRCYECNLTIDMKCVRNPPEAVIDDSKSHIEHTLTLMLKEISFTCDACGKAGHHSPWVCLQCCFVVHRRCIDLPHVIRICRHQHRISLTYSLRPGDWSCGVCQREVDWKCGAYCCSLCSYMVHTHCATDTDVWDGEELEGVPEAPYQVVNPFEMIGKGVINHFSHTHNLKLTKNDNGVGRESRRCKACVLPISSDPSYNCRECDFIIHEACANLPLKKQHPLITQPLALHADNRADPCHICHRFHSGFQYRSRHFVIDVNCGSLSEPFIHEGHPHPLFFTLTGIHRCRACGSYKTEEGLSCIKCNFHLCCTCATLPRTVRHKYDEHPAILCLGEQERGPYTYWCEICEEELDPEFLFYASEGCGFTCHVDCLLGDFLLVKPGQGLKYRGGQPRFKAVENNGTSRPSCWKCKRRCQSPMILKRTDYADRYICSQRCLE